MKIVCNECVSLEEGLTVEFKTSILFSPDQTISQQETIAKTIASFINTEGGKLYLGVDNNGVIVGVESDLKALAHCSSQHTTKGPFCSDTGYKYHGTLDHFYLKLQKIIEAYLGRDSLRFLKDYEKIESNGSFYVVAPVEKANNGEFVYFSSLRKKEKEIVIRTPGSSRVLYGEDRDAFIIRKTQEKQSNENAMATALSELQDAVRELVKNDPVGEDKNEEVNAIVEGEKKPLKVPDENQIMGLMLRIQDILYKSPPVLKECRELYVTINGRTRASDVIDLFEKQQEGVPVYGRLELRKAKKIDFFPCSYDGISDPMQLQGVDFAIDYVSFLIERSTVTFGNSEILVTYRNQLPFTGLKSTIEDGGKLVSFIWDEIRRSKVIQEAPLNVWTTLVFSRFYQLLVNNDEPSVWIVPSGDVYRIVGIRFAKRNLFGGPQPGEWMCDFKKKCRAFWPSEPEGYCDAWENHPMDYYTTEDF